VKMCMKKRPPGFNHDRTRIRRSRQFIMCSNISTETIRSNRSSTSNLFMSRVMTRRFFRPRLIASSSISSCCESSSTSP